MEQWCPAKGGGCISEASFSRGSTVQARMFYGWTLNYKYLKSNESAAGRHFNMDTHCTVIDHAQFRLISGVFFMHVH